MTSAYQAASDQVPLPRPRKAAHPSLLSAELGEFDTVQLRALAADIRAHLVSTVCAAGGHLGSNLGVVELTIALHRAFRSPWDAVLFDIGHQAYVHKMLTGRWDRFRTLRQAGGLSGYPSRAESAHDFIENSHASTVISYADGMARAIELIGNHGRRVAAVIGDGALTGGMCWEAMNNLGGSGKPVVLVLNDNERSYDPTLGSVAEHLSALRAGTADGNLFEQLGFEYLGPIDGHDFDALDDAFALARSRPHPVLVHCVTVKGKGYARAERDEADRMHGIGVIDPATGRSTQPAAVSWTNVFAEEIADIARDRVDVVGVTAAMRLPVGFGRFAAEFPDRVIDVGMAEQHALTSAAGLAMGGMHPVVAVYSTFLNRAFDQLLMDVALHRLPVTLVLDRAGVTGPDGPSHHGMWDLSLLAMVPGMRVACPRDTDSLRTQLRQAVSCEGPTAIRFPKASAGPAVPACATVGDVDLLSADGNDVLIVAVGQLAPMCLRAAEILREQGIGVTVADPRWVLPVSPSLVDLVAGFRVALVVEDGLGSGGIGDAVARACAASDVDVPVRSMGLPTRFLAHGSRNGVLAQVGLDAESIARHVGGLL
ncbi:1-deoxy-D-xylulose-5-phosphate synthase [Kutzneria kofuensis]|uniref:1-deoxy-D-xylulose-5-phosphate synthase n=1 Tax=Kutzneria kofuensis TaxID=103725 RepID=A0A7W9KN93_9PSEU|nr:1-deoxy-D-xylulose-5-phosphate synthase [Kutzneria kofuensis]MBB5895428.1 1-deoxy-D-xylulose-5-phosphate synthase [Kutzneria kofuensis]